VRLAPTTYPKEMLMTRSLKDQTENARPHRAVKPRAPRRVIDGYPAGYVAQLARPLMARAAGYTGEHPALTRPSGFRMQTSARVAD
jgi:hypothetical protein